jgi:hypothetical protein
MSSKNRSTFELWLKAETIRLFHPFSAFTDRGRQAASKSHNSDKIRQYVVQIIYQLFAPGVNVNTIQKAERIEATPGLLLCAVCSSPFPPLNVFIVDLYCYFTYQELHWIMMLERGEGKGENGIDRGWKKCSTSSLNLFPHTLAANDEVIGTRNWLQMFYFVDSIMINSIRCDAMKSESESTEHVQTSPRPASGW